MENQQIDAGEAPPCDSHPLPCVPMNDLPKDIIDYHAFCSSTWDVPVVASFALDPSCYNRNQECLRKLFGKFDYHTVPGKIVVWQPPQRHDIFIASIEKYIVEQLKMFTSSSPEDPGKIIREIQNEGRSPISLKDGSELHPDRRFRYNGAHDAKSPVITITVSTAQSHEEVMDKTRKLLIETNGWVKTAFQRANGLPANLQMTMNIPLRDFAPKGTDMSNWPLCSISIPFNQLSHTLTHAAEAEGHRNLALNYLIYGHESDSEGDDEEYGCNWGSNAVGDLEHATK
ncbi:hypothetical protein FBEOM_5792 [Fusarium beomiforme]|uniref:Uncharacterized protein n=1 Tax=Fusarium beomiforme TaxID=44412 RepID=A0A9P5AK85_9HYPO|nr:hypothetical protein FBEOM_5792 [Fusarium beomiforme]